ncbi:MAG: SurA N-terminal domain-containing protein [Bacteroidia bacterium]|nr:SurA N-terminal domain-containing protein [Bacteroidia bacterium]
MSVLSRIRQNIGLIVGIISLALLAFIIDPSSLQGFFSQPPAAGEVAGESISMREYQDEVSSVLQSQGGALDPVREGQLRDQVWDNMVMRRLYNKEFGNIGIEVTKDELLSMFIGKHVDPTFLQAPIFKDSLGNFSPQIVQQWYTYMAENDPDGLVAQEERLELNRRFQKYYSMIQGAFFTPSEYAKAVYKQQNKKVNISYVTVPFSAVADSAVTVTESDLKNYITRFKHRYEQKDETVIRYSKFPILANKRDSMSSVKKMVKYKPLFSKYKNDSLYTQARSSQPYRKSYDPLARLPEAIRDSIKGAADKEVFGPILVGDSYRLFKLVGKEKAEEAYGKIAHIQINFSNDTAAAEKKARGLLAEARTGNFGDVAEKNSQDFGSRIKGGEVGWYRAGSYGEDFDERVSKASVGSVIGPIKGIRGYHIVKVLDKTDFNYDIAQIEDQIIYSTATKDSVYGLANRFAQKLFTSQDINASAAEMNVAALSSNPLTPESRTIQGLQAGRELRELILWAVNAGEGDYTNKVYRVGDDYILAQVFKKTSAGLRPLDDIRAEVERAVLNEKKGEYLANKLQGMSGQDFETVKNNMGTGARTGSSKDLTMTSNSVTGLGTEPKVVGRAFSLAQGEASSPIIGTSGVHLIKVDQITDSADPNEAEIASLKTTLENNLRRSVMEQTDGDARRSRLDNTLRDLNGVVDNRAKAESRNYGF